jgi:hypothetical protein
VGLNRDVGDAIGRGRAYQRKMTVGCQGSKPVTYAWRRNSRCGGATSRLKYRMDRIAQSGPKWLWSTEAGSSGSIAAAGSLLIAPALRGRRIRAPVPDLAGEAKLDAVSTLARPKPASAFGRGFPC